MTLKAKAGIALIVLGFGTFGFWTWWKNTRTFVPVDAPISLTAGQTVTKDFQLNFDGSYLVEIEADKSLPSTTLRCLMGVPTDATQCNETPSALDVNWIVSSRSQPIKSGASNDLPRASTETIALTRILGEFQGESGQSYKLQITSAADGTPLATAHPRVKVAVASIAYTDLQSAGVLVFSLAFICVFFGFIFLAVALHAMRKPKPENS
jgi:hypothetical protein